MAQYRLGKASATNGSATITGTGTAWLSNIDQGDAFTIAGTSVVYTVAGVQSDTQLTLSTPYSGSTVTDFTYAITRDFTSPDNFPELVSGDIETPTILTRAIRKIQQKFNTMSDGGLSKSEEMSRQATFKFDFSENRYRVYEGLSSGMVDKTFSQAVTLTRSSVANAHNALGDIEAAAINTQRLVGNREGLLVEYGRTNLALYSEDFTNAVHVKVGATIATLQDPDSPANKLVENTSTGAHSVSQSVSATSGETYTSSYVLKAGGRGKITMEHSGDYTSNVFQFDLITGTITSQGDPRNFIKNVGSGYWVCSITTEASATGSGTTTVELNDNSGNRSYTGDGSSGAYIWGLQVELGDTASSYIKTTTSQVTRAADQVRRVFANEVNASEGTFLIDVNLASFTDVGGGDSQVFEVSNGTSTGRISVGTQAGGSVVASVNFGGSTYNLSVLNGSEDIKIAVSYTRSSVAIACGGETSTQSTVENTSNFSEMRLGYSVGSGSMLGVFKNVWYMPTSLSPSDMADVTS